MRRFFVDPDNINGQTAILTGAEARHIATVLRLGPETQITLFDGSGSFYEALIVKITPARVETKITAITPYIETPEAERPALHLAVGLVKGKKMDVIIQKSTELGIESLRPFRSAYCAVPDRETGRLSRWRKIILEACKQCNRPKPPALDEIIDFQDLISRTGREAFDLKVMFWEEEQRFTLRQRLTAAGDIHSALILIGPEGGFSAAEVEAASAAGFQPASLGSRILRTETAVIAATAILQHEFGSLA